MRTRAEVISALYFAVNRHAAEEAKLQGMVFGTPDQIATNVLVCMWAGEIKAYRYVLRVNAGEADPFTVDASCEPATGETAAELFERGMRIVRGDDSQMSDNLKKADRQWIDQ